MSVENVPDATDSQRTLLMGSQPTQMNLTKLLECSDQLWQELETLRKDLESNASSKTFRQVLTQLDVAGRKFSQLQKELRPQLQYYVSHPMYITDYHAQVVTEQLSNMPIPEMREADAMLLEGLPDATHAPHAREAKLRQISSIPLRHNKSIAENSQNAEVLHEKVRILNYGALLNVPEPCYICVNGGFARKCMLSRAFLEPTNFPSARVPARSMLCFTLNETTCTESFSSACKKSRHETITSRLHPESKIQKEIRNNRHKIQQHLVQLLRQRMATHQSVSHGVAPADLGLDSTARQVLTALKKGSI